MTRFALFTEPLNKFKTLKIFGIIPVRMAASRFPGKPLKEICGVPMMDHVYQRAKLFNRWDKLCVATCDAELFDHSQQRGYPVVMTGEHHTRALDRVAEAAQLLNPSMADDDIVVCVQGDEPLLTPEMIQAVIEPIETNEAIDATMLAIHIVDESLWRNPDIVKIISNEKNQVLYTSRAPLPYSKQGLTPELGARRVGGIFAFKWARLKQFTEHPETRLEKVESCDSNRILDMDFTQYIAPFANTPYYSVDSPQDIELVEAHMHSDPLWQHYKDICR